MKLLRVAIGWAGALAIAAGARLAADRIDTELAQEGRAVTTGHLAGQRCEQTRLSLELAADPLELHGRLQAAVRTETPLYELHAIAPDDVEIEAATIDGEPAIETTPWLAKVVAVPRAERRLEAQRPEPGTLTQASIRFRRAVVGPRREPLPCVCNPAALIELAPEARLDELEVVVPPGLSLVTAGLGADASESSELVVRGPGRHSLGPWERDRAPLVLGRLGWRAALPTLGTIRFVGSESDLPSSALEVRTRELLLRTGTPAEAPPRTILFRPGLEPGEVTPLGHDWFAAAPPRDPAELACILLASALALRPPPEPDPLVTALPIVLVLHASEPEVGRDSAERPAFARSPAAARGFAAWRALEAVFGTRVVDAARELYAQQLGGVAAKPPPLLAEPSARALIRWAQDGVTVELDSWKLESVRGRTLASGEVVITPPPPQLPSMLPVTIAFVGDEQVQEERLFVAGERTRFADLPLAEVPLEVAIDPAGWLPREDGTHAIPLELMPRAFAAAPDAGALAIALVRGGADPSCGVSILRSDGDGELGVSRWQPTNEPPSALDWGALARYLVITAGDEATVVDATDGAVLPFRGALRISPRRRYVLESSERAPGCFAHTLHDLARGLSWPLPVARRGTIAWVDGGDELVEAGFDGRATIVDRRGRMRFELPWLLHSVRVLRRETFGFVAAVDTAQGGRVALFNVQGRPLRSLAVEGRVYAITWSSDTGALLVFARAGPGEHVVTRIALEEGDGDGGVVLYRGADRPLPDAPSRRGILLVDAASDAAPPGEPRRVTFLSWDAFARGGADAGGEEDGGGTARLVSAEAFLNPPPTVASAGRYLYYLRARGGPAGLRGELRPRALYRYDFLAGHEEPLEIAK